MTTPIEAIQTGYVTKSGETAQIYIGEKPAGAVYPCVLVIPYDGYTVANRDLPILDYSVQIMAYSHSQKEAQEKAWTAYESLHQSGKDGPWALNDDWVCLDSVCLQPPYNQLGLEEQGGRVYRVSINVYFWVRKAG